MLLSMVLLPFLVDKPICYCLLHVDSAMNKLGVLLLSSKNITFVVIPGLKYPPVDMPLSGDSNLPLCSINCQFSLCYWHHDCCKNQSKILGLMEMTWTRIISLIACNQLYLHDFGVHHFLHFVVVS